MGLLDDVIGAALGPKSGSGLSSPIAMALMALLASKMAPGASAQQNPVGGLGGLLDQLRQNGLEQAVNSWIGAGQNHPVSPTQLHQALGQDRVDQVAAAVINPRPSSSARVAGSLPRKAT